MQARVRIELLIDTIETVIGHPGGYDEMPDCQLLRDAHQIVKDAMEAGEYKIRSMEIIDFIQDQPESLLKA